jgi:hypothetical protein
LADLVEDELWVVVVVERPAFVVEDAVKGIARDEFDIILALAAGQLENIVKHKRRGDDRGAGIKLEAVLSQRRRPGRRACLVSQISTS